MHTDTMMRSLALAGLSTLIAAPVFAQDTSHYYGGISVGRSQTDVDAAGFTANLLPGVSAVGSTSDEKDTAYKLFGGYQMNRNLALEAGYFNLGTSSFTATTLPAGTLAGQSKVYGLNFDLVGTMPMTARFSALARIGAQHARIRDSFSGTGAGAAIFPNHKHHSTNLKLGLGLQYEITPSMWVRAELERYRVKNVVGRRDNIDVATVSLVFPFGRAPAPAPVVAAAPEPEPAPVYVAPTPTPPPPEPTPMPVVPVRQRVSFSSDTLFGFDSSALQPKGREALDDFGKEIAGTRVETITVEGHTDRIGSEKYNQALSQRRAEAVKSYLVDKGIIDAGRITAVGMGEGRPTTTATDCPNRLSRPKLIECLKADRRVEVDISGTR